MSKTLNLSTWVATQHVLPRPTPIEDEKPSFVVADDLSRTVYGLLGLSLDALNFSSLLQSMENAVARVTPFLISTPNVNFLITSQKSDKFRDSILESDLCLTDGMPLIWIAKLLGIPIRERIAGSDLFGRLKSAGSNSRPLKVFLLGGADGVGEAVCWKLNAEKCGLRCVGVLNPGFGSVEEMSSNSIIEAINATQADLLAVFFGAQKAQTWLIQNHSRLSVPVRAQFGATINFEAGIVKRAPRFMRSTGFEWLWRIKEEPYLWRRYWEDGKALAKLMLTSVLPLMIDAHIRRRNSNDLEIKMEEGPEACSIFFAGDATALSIDQAVFHFRRAINIGRPIWIDLSKVKSVDARMFGLFLMVRKQMAMKGLPLFFWGASRELRRTFRLNRFEFLLS